MSTRRRAGAVPAEPPSIGLLAEGAVGNRDLADGDVRRALDIERHCKTLAWTIAFWPRGTTTRVLVRRAFAPLLQGRDIREEHFGLRAKFSHCFSLLSNWTIAESSRKRLGLRATHALRRSCTQCARVRRSPLRSSSKILSESFARILCTLTAVVQSLAVPRFSLETSCFVDVVYYDYMPFIAWQSSKHFCSATFSSSKPCARIEH